MGRALLFRVQNKEEYREKLTQGDWKDVYEYLGGGGKYML